MRFPEEPLYLGDRYLGEMHPMRNSLSCVDCGAAAPDTDSEFTLISSPFGWRLVRTRNEDGSFVFEWRCPACWARHKQRGAVPSSSPSRARRASRKQRAAI